MDIVKRQLDGRTLYVLATLAEIIINQYYPEAERQRVVASNITVGEIHSALANVRYVLEHVKFEVVE